MTRAVASIVVTLAACGSRSGIPAAEHDVPTADASTSPDAAAGPDAGADAKPCPPELCNGLDDDCDGLVDEGYTLKPAATDVSVRISSPLHAYAAPSGLAWNGQAFLALFEGGPAGTARVYTALLAPDGTLLGSEKQTTQIGAPAHGGTTHGQQATWTGDRFIVVWTDERFGQYDIHAAMLDAAQNKLPPGDMRLSVGVGLSFNPAVAWTGDELVVTWQESPPGSGHIHAQRLGPKGQIYGTEQILSSSGGSFPSVASAPHGLGVAWASSDVRFRVFGASVTPLADEIVLSPPETGGTLPRAAWVGDRWFVAWHDEHGSVPTIWGATVNASGGLLDAPRILIDTPGHARYPSLLVLGDHVVLTFADDRDGNEGYELYVASFKSDLGPAGPAHRVTHAPGDSIFPIPARSGSDAGILFHDTRGGSPQVYFVRLECADL